jgi:hypothetical protein
MVVRRAACNGERVERRGRRDKVGGNELGALMQQLVEGVLPVRASCTPEDGLL